MIANLKDTPMRTSGVIYQSALQQLRMLFPKDPQLAGELAISIIELTLTGEISSDDLTIQLATENLRNVVKNNQEKYDKTKETKRQSKIQEYKLDTIADLLKKGKSQSDIAKLLGVNKQTISYRINNMIKPNYPELLFDVGDKSNEKFLTSSGNESKNLTSSSDKSNEIFDFSSIGSKKSDETNKNFLTDDNYQSKKSDKSDKNSLTTSATSQKSQISPTNVNVNDNVNDNVNFLTFGQKLPTISLADARSIADKDLIDADQGIIKDLKTNIIYQIIQ